MTAIRQLKMPSDQGVVVAKADEGTRVAAVTFPIDEAKVREIASRGYPLAESVPTMQLRNRRITVAYGNLSLRLAQLIAAGVAVVPAEEQSGLAPDVTPGESVESVLAADLDANWCTFATWSSRTIGESISNDPQPGSLGTMTGPFLFVRPVRWMAARLLTRDHGAIYRSLAAGNRFVFLEIGVAVARFLDQFDAPVAGTSEADTRPSRELQWERYWSGIEGMLEELGHLDPSWVATTPPDRSNLQLGLRRYFDAMHERDRRTRAQLVLAGNLAVSAYEQQRVDGYLAVSLSMFPSRALRQLIRRRTGTFRSLLRRAPSALYSMALTLGLLELETGDELLRVGRELPWRPSHPGGALFPADLDVIEDPCAQALLTIYDCSEGDRKRTRAHNWIWFADRMNYITNLMRSRQQHPGLFRRPFDLQVTAQLLAGELAHELAGELLEKGALPDLFAGVTGVTGETGN